MCIGLPMTVLAVEPGHALCDWRGERRRVDTALVGDCQPGERLLVFIDSARERLDEDRAAEIEATLELLAGVLGGERVASGLAEAGFMLPSAMSVDELARYTGAAVPALTTSVAPVSTPAVTIADPKSVVSAATTPADTFA
jgi:hydrogenase expression/formation protein HypC